MKRVILAYKDPDNNPSDRAEAIIQSLGTSITNLHNIRRKYAKLYEENGYDDALMSNLSDIAGDMLKQIDMIVDTYKNKEIQ